MTTATIHGSHGSLTVHVATGHIVERKLEGDEYADIPFFDPTPIARWRGDLDILAAGYWTTRGDYAEPLTIRLTQWRGGTIFDDWVPLRLLPAPRQHDPTSEIA
ncbi:hypothetical protein Sj15T_10150 [Sphingobium sp. TA15]|uniref:Uncharacterized protein n=1 Tax=Sphingobium indicum (strain DSM 16413 / CCM 7287 / MTCC 6362 / UT26 / NBRC 101211 / UT26S) TaxID=452662 RepID=D4Z8T6_SPHIU|nr:hypothetical protein [Sphingobium indicum]BAI99018.1 hypothetical protein SJA_P1-00660 [Sphingobium indicum UT26S]BDD65994.1 hypothetical protein Sj15T_10150 [Sphingobium sp. TA15]